jgi:hypothetical protein
MTFTSNDGEQGGERRSARFSHSKVSGRRPVTLVVRRYAESRQDAHENRTRRRPHEDRHHHDNRLRTLLRNHVWGKLNRLSDWSAFAREDAEA